MSTDRAEELAEYALGLMSDDEAHAFDAELRASATLREALRETLAALDVVAAAAPPVAPPPTLEARILAATSPVRERYAGFEARLARLFDLSVEIVREHLQRVVSPPPQAHWLATEVAGVWLYHLDGGPATAGTDCGFVFLEPGAQFPRHGHSAREEALVIAGEARTSEDDEWLPGSHRIASPDDRHGFRVVGDAPFVFAVRLDGPIQPDSR